MRLLVFGLFARLGNNHRACSVVALGRDVQLWSAASTVFWFLFLQLVAWEFFGLAFPLFNLFRLRAKVRVSCWGIQRLTIPSSGRPKAALLGSLRASRSGAAEVKR